MFRLIAMLFESAASLMGEELYAKTRAAVGGNLFRTKTQNQLLSALTFRLTGPIYNLLRPLFNVSFRQSLQWRELLGEKSRIFFTSKPYRRIEKGLPFNSSTGWDTHDSGFLKWYLKKYGGNKFLDVLLSASNKPNHQKNTEIKRMGGTTTKTTFKGGTYASLSDVIEGALKAYQVNLKDPALNSKQELKKAYGMMNVKDPRKTPVMSTSFPQAPMSWMNSGLYSDKTNYATFTTQKGYMFPVHMNLNGFKSMSRSVHPGKVLWNGPWFFKRRKTLKIPSVRRLGRRKGLL